MNRVRIERNQCKGCGVCIKACPRHCLELGQGINAIGYRPAEFAKAAKCAACGLCFYVCPEPGAITVIKEEDPAPGSKSGQGGGDE